MKAKFLSLALVLVIVAALFNAPTQVKAAGYGTAFATSITFQNVGTADATLYVTFYPANGAAPIQWSPEGVLKPNAGASLFVGSVSGVGTGFQGSAVMTSNQPMVAVLVQIPQAPSTVKNRPLSTGLSQGAPNVLIPTVLKNTFSTHSIFVVQNADSVVNDMTLTFVPVSGAPINVEANDVAPGMAKYYDMSKVTEITAASFNGSVVIQSWKDGTAKTATPNGAVVATSLELSLTSDNVYAFEGTSVIGNTLYMPSAFCKYGGAINSSYAVQNTDPTLTQNAVVTVTYSGINNTTKAAVNTTEGPFTITPGGKKSLLGCGDNGTVNPANFIGSAVITSVGAPIVGIGKITGLGISSAFNGLTAGAARVALPYIRWTESQWTTGARQRSNIAIQNVGTAIPAGQNVTVKYYDKDGNLVGTDTLAGPIATGAKVNSNPKKLGTAGNEFGAPLPGTTAFGGGAVVEGPAGSLLAVIVRVETFNAAAGTGTFGEDYNGIPIP